MRVRSQAQFGKLLALEAAGKVARGTAERAAAAGPAVAGLPRRVGRAPRARKSNRKSPVPSVSREARRQAREGRV